MTVQLTLVLPHTASAGEVGLEIDPRIRFNDWKALGEALRHGVDRSLWFVADWAAFGLAKVREDPEWDVYRAAVEQVVHKSALDSIAGIARKIPPAQRSEQLSFADHAVVAGLPEDERDAWLGDCLRHDWGPKELRQELARSKGLPDPPPTLSVKIVAEHYELVLAGARRRGIDPKAWLLEAIRSTYDRESAELEGSTSA
jgi:hypothetical protein